MNIQDEEQDVSSRLRSLFSEAKSNGGVEYIYTLVRVSGLAFGVQDPFLELRSALQTINVELPDEELLSQYCSIVSIDEPLALIANLLNCTRRKPYDMSPFHHLVTSQFPGFVTPTPSQLVTELVKIAEEAGKPEIVRMIEESHPRDVLAGCSSGVPRPPHEHLVTALQECRVFLTSLLEIYFTERLSYRDQPRFYKLPGFEVLELMINDESGLYGFRMHFSNGSYAGFARHRDSTESTNVWPDVPIGFMVGNLDELRQEWRVGDKRLYEVGLQGRYNRLGYWKPIIYPGDPEPLARDARSRSKDDQVQGSLFYMMCTGYRVIEFAVRTAIELPTEGARFGGRIHLWKCPPLATGQNVFLYDGWIDLDSTDPDYIRSAIATVGVTLNRMAFAYDAPVTWRLKYRMAEGLGGYATPTEEDLHVLDSLLREFPRTEDAFVLDAAIDWYNHGGSARTAYIGFLCYYIALESVALAVADDTADLGIVYARGNRIDRERKRLDCIREKHDAAYAKDPVGFVRESYFDCVVGLKEKTRRVAELVFGSGHSYLAALFDKRDGYSLSDIRGRLAHGAVMPLDSEEDKLVKARLPEIAEISKEFLARVIFLLKPTDPLPSWSQSYSSSLSMADPRATMYATKESILPTTDWRIRPEWCD